MAICRLALVGVLLALLTGFSGCALSRTNQLSQLNSPEKIVMRPAVESSRTPPVETGDEGAQFRAHSLFVVNSSNHPPRRTPIFAPRHSVDDLPAGSTWEEISESPSLIDRIFEDHLNYYSSNNFAVLATGFVIGAGFANSSLDGDIDEHVNHSVLNAPSDEWSEFFHGPKDFGNGAYTLPIFAAAWAAGILFDESQVGQAAGEWGERSLRSFLVGAPPVILMQMVTGAGRPEEGGSAWSFMDDNNGVSGHSFMGALPFLTAAQMTEEPWAKFAFYAASTAVPISRVTDGDHFASQAILGWWMAWSATMAIDATQAGDAAWRTLPLIGPDYSGMGIEYRW